MVNNNVFAALAVKWNFHNYIKFVSTQMFDKIHRFVQHQKQRKDRIEVEQVRKTVNRIYGADKTEGKQGAEGTQGPLGA